MKMFIANLTHQAVDFGYRLPEDGGLRRQRIEVGSQIRLSGELSPTDVDAIVRQYTKYGMIDVAEVDRTKGFAGLCYSIDKPITVEKLRRGVVHNDAVLNEEGRKSREAAAVATSARIESSLPQEEGAPKLQSLEVTVEEEKPGDIGDHDEINERLVVSRDDVASSKRVGSRTRRKSQLERRPA